MVEEDFPYGLQPPYGAPSLSSFSAPTGLLAPDLNPSIRPLLDAPAFTLDPNVPFFPSTPQSISHLSAGSPPVNGQDIAYGIPSLYQATARLSSPLHMPDHTYPPLYSESDVILAKARDWMECNPGQKVESDTLEGAFRQLHKHTWECLSCGETRKRREQIAHHIRGMHLDNRGFYHCDEPGWYSILLHQPGYRHPSDHLPLLALFRPTQQAT